MKNKIVWQYWVDPLGLNLDKVGEPNYKNIKKHFDEQQDIYEPEETVDDAFQPIGPFKIAQTPYGLATIGYANSPDTNFIRWVGHSNFDITEEMVNDIERVPGVEGLHIFSRYRFLVMIGLCGFKETDVKNAVQSVMFRHAEADKFDKYSVLQPEDRQKVQLLREQLKKQDWKYLAILVLFNGEVTAVYSKDCADPDYIKKKTLLVETYSKVGGFLFEEDGEEND